MSFADDLQRAGFAANNRAVLYKYLRLGPSARYHESLL